MVSEASQSGARMARSPVCFRPGSRPGVSAPGAPLAGITRRQARCRQSPSGATAWLAGGGIPAELVWPKPGEQRVEGRFAAPHIGDQAAFRHHDQPVSQFSLAANVGGDHQGAFAR